MGSIGVFSAICLNGNNGKDRRNDNMGLCAEVLFNSFLRINRRVHRVISSLSCQNYVRCVFMGINQAVKCAGNQREVKTKHKWIRTNSCFTAIWEGSATGWSGLMIIAGVFVCYFWMDAFVLPLIKKIGMVTRKLLSHNLAGIYFSQITMVISLFQIQGIVWKGLWLTFFDSSVFLCCVVFMSY